MVSTTVSKYGHIRGSSKQNLQDTSNFVWAAGQFIAVPEAPRKLDRIRKSTLDKKSRKR